MVLLLFSIPFIFQTKQSPLKTHLQWAQSQYIPPSQGKTIQPGLAGAIVGVASNHLLIAGGSNFEDALPWRGGKKLYHDDIFMLHETDRHTYKWSLTHTRLPFSMAYSGCATTPKGVICIGGENEQGPFSQAFILSVEEKQPSFRRLPDLTYKVSNPGVAVIGTTVFVVGGLDHNRALSSFNCIDISKDHPVWVPLPNLPVSLSHAVVVAQWSHKEQCIYVIGGRVKEGIITTFLSSVWEYAPSTKQWKLVGQIQTEGNKVIRLSAGTGVAVGRHEIVVFGGDKGIIYNQTEQFIAKIDALKSEAEKAPVIQEKISLLENHPGFFNEVLIFNTESKTFSSAGKIPGAVQVTTSAVNWKEKVFIPGGEIKPGIRTSEVKVVFIK